MAGNLNNPLRIVFTGNAPLSVYQDAIAMVSFFTNSAISGDRIIEVVANDGTDNSDPVISTVTVAGIADLLVTTPTGYDLSTLYAAINDSDVTSDHDANGFLAVGAAYAFRVHGHDFAYSGSVNAPDVDSGTITSIDILTDSCSRSPSCPGSTSTSLRSTPPSTSTTCRVARIPRCSTPFSKASRMLPMAARARMF